MENARKNKKITVLVPCYNEEQGIGEVIKKFPRQKLSDLGFELQVLVIDNNSTDHTAEVARAHGATVVSEKKKGKGNAIRTGFKSVSMDTDYVVMLDGDDTYRSEEIIRMIEPLDSGFCDVVVGSRLGGRIYDGSMTKFNHLGNVVFSTLVRFFYSAKVTDVLTGYFAWRREAMQRLLPHLISEGFSIEMEMITKMARLGERVYSVPISYDKRAGSTNLRPIYDGLRILKMLLKNLLWSPSFDVVTKEKKRIVFVSDAVFPYNNGGKEKRLYEISKRLVDEETEVHIYTMNWWDGKGEVVHDGVHFHSICKNYPLYVKDRRSMRQAIMFGLATFKLLFVKFDVLDVDSIPYFPLYSAKIVTLIRGKKMYATWHEVWGRKYWLHYLGGVSGLIGYIIERLSFFMPDVVISNSENTTVRLREAGFRKEIKTIPLGVDLKDIYNAELVNNPSDIIYVGRLIAHKNVDLLIRAVAIAKKLRNQITCKIVGNGPEKNKLMQLIHELDLEDNIQFISVDDNNYLYGLMKSSKMLVLPSVREGFGLVVIEANAAGLPVITTSHEDNAAKDLITDGVNGLLVEPTERGVADGILKVLENLNIMEPQKNIEKYDWRIVMKKVRIALF